MWPMPKVKVNYGPLQVTFILKLLANAGLLRWSPSLWFLYSNDLMIIKCRNKEHIFSRETVGHPRNTHYTGWFSSSFLETDVWNPFFHCVYLSFIHLLVQCTSLKELQCIICFMLRKECISQRNLRFLFENTWDEMQIPHWKAFTEQKFWKTSLNDNESVNIVKHFSSCVLHNV